MRLAPGMSVGRYRIVGLLGAGGMGEVYRALDTRLKREVALKVLPADLVADPDRRRRFFLEAEATAALCHPRIATVYDADDADGVCYLAMELVSGASLTQRLRSGALPAGEALALADEIGEGLACAHASGILHRDLKPANVMLDAGGHAKLIDFGLAKLLESASGETTTGMATADGRVLGTAAYMAPEQARGLPVDVRTDIFSFGVLLYELLTGCRPFDRGSWPDSVAAVLRDPVPPLSAPGFTGESAGLAQQLLDRCLAKDAAKRPGSMTDVLRDLDAIRRMITPSASGESIDSTRRPVAEQASIAVLPFENLSPDPDNAFFADGLTEELIADLSKVRALRVISRTSAMHYKGTTKPLPVIAHELNVRHVLEGSVRRAGNNLRITAQLIDAATDAHLWAEKYSGTLDDVFDLQERLSRRIVDALRVVLTPDEDRRLGARGAASPRVYEVWLRARHAFHELTPDGFQRGARLAREALETFGDHALLHAALAYFGYAMYDFGFSHDDQTLADADRHAARSVELDPQLAQAHLVAGLVRWKYGDSQGMVRYLHRSLDLEWNSDAAGYLSFGLVCVGKTAEARPYAAEAAARDPLSYLHSLPIALADFYDGHLTSALARFRDSRQRLDPDGFLATWWVAQAAALAGLEDEAQTLFDRVAVMGASVFSDTSRLFALALRDDRAGAVAWLESADSMRAIAVHDEVYPTVIATALARVGEHDRALEWLGHAISWGMSNHRFLAGHNRFLAPLRGDPRFEVLMDRAREKQRAFEV